MKVLFLKTVAGTAKIGDIKNVSDGYAQNALFPKKLAVLATDEVIRAHQESQKAQMTDKQGREAALLKILADIPKRPVRIIGSGDAGGHLFKGIHIPEIRDAYLKTYREVLPGELFPNQSLSLKTKGKHEVVISHGKRSAILVVEVV